VAGFEELHDRLDELTRRSGEQLLVQQVVPRVAAQPQQEAAWWYQQLALLHYQELGQELPFRVVLDAATRAMFFDEVVGVLLSEATVDLATLMVPSEVKRSARQARLCLHCRPSLTGSLIGAFVERDFVLHRLGAKCEVGDASFVVHGPPRNLDLYVLRTVNRTGLAADVFRVFAELGVEVVDVAATRVGARTGVFRVQLEQLSPEVRRDLDTSLGRLPGVVAVERPGSSKVLEEMLGGPLPPRRSVRALDEGMEEPFFCGDKILDDGFFYNMKDQKATLVKLLHGVANNSQAGTAVWICGPKKVGKSSLALSFLREIASRGDGYGEYIETIRGESWTAFAERFTARLYPQPGPRPGSLAEAVRSRVEQVGGPLVVVIDEAVNLLMNSVKKGDLEGLLQFRSQISSSPGVLLIWVGPIGNVEGLPPSAKHLLQSAAHRMAVPPLNEADVESMLTCQKLALSCIVTVEKGLPSIVWHVTGGNPFWVAHLGRAMWEISRRRGQTERVHFDLPLLGQARRMVCAEELPFQDRLTSEHWDAETALLAHSVLKTLADGSGRRMRTKMNGLSIDEIWSRLSDTPARARVKTILEDLESRGSINWDASDRGPLWRLSAPMLADHLAPPAWFDEP
jgi:predicted amino acid-binding ACT domain protein